MIQVGPYVDSGGLGVLILSDTGQSGHYREPD